MLEFDLLRVFVDSEGDGGWPLAVFLIGESIDVQDRPATATALGVAATVFVDDRERATVRIFTARGREAPLAGHALLGAAWLLDASGLPAWVLRTSAGQVLTWREDDLVWVRAAPEGLPQVTATQVGSPAEVKTIPEGGNGAAPVQTWAWEERERGLVCSHAPFGGSPGGAGDPIRLAALCLDPSLRRRLTIRTPGGLLLHARPATDGGVELGGRVAFVAAADYDTFTAPRL